MYNKNNIKIFINGNAGAASFCFTTNNLMRNLFSQKIDFNVSVEKKQQQQNIVTKLKFSCYAKYILFYVVWMWMWIWMYVDVWVLCIDIVVDCDILENNSV